jgi:AraC-like DNA-binding protein
MSIDCASSGRGVTDGHALSVLKQECESAERAQSLATRARRRGGSQRREAPAARSHDNGPEQCHAVHSVELHDHGGGLPEASLRRVVEHLQAHLDQRLSVTALAAVAHLSPYHFSRLFKHSTGLSPHQYLVRQRITRAKELLADPTRRVADVSYELGFPHQSHFTTVFGKVVGTTPSAYQRQRSGK